jgi:hypothetical protein
MKYVKPLKVGAFALVTVVLGCSVSPGTHEKTGPSVVFREGDKTIDRLFLDPNTATPSVFAAKSFACVANDSGGVASVTMSFSQTIDICVFNGGCGDLTTFCLYGGGLHYHLSPAMPALQTATSHPDSSGQVPNELFLFANLQGPYKCVGTERDITKVGEPYGQTVTAMCTATNYSKKQTSASLPITFNSVPAESCCTGSKCNCGLAHSSTEVVTVCCANTTCQSGGSVCK